MFEKKEKIMRELKGSRAERKAGDRVRDRELGESSRRHEKALWHPSVCPCLSGEQILQIVRKECWPQGPLDLQP